VIREFCHKQNVTEQTLFRSRNKYGGVDVSDFSERPGAAARRVHW